MVATAKGSLRNFKVPQLLCILSPPKNYFYTQMTRNREQLYYRAPVGVKTIGSLLLIFSRHLFLRIYTTYPWRSSESLVTLEAQTAPLFLNFFEMIPEHFEGWSFKPDSGDD